MMPVPFLANVTAGTINILSYTMLGIVAMLLVSGPIVVYYYYRKSRRMKTGQSASPV